MTGPKTGSGFDSFVTRNAWLRRSLNAANNARCKTWDVLHGVDTCGEIPLSSYDFQSANKTHGLPYHSHHPRIIRSALAALECQHENYTFIDFGCGKGRVLLVASQFSFRRILGLEFAPPLAEIASRNLNSYRCATQKCCNLEVIFTDVTNFELPREPEVLYFYNPFTVKIMNDVVQNIRDSLQRFPRPLIVLFSGPMVTRDRGFAGQPQFERLRRERYFDIYQYRLR